VVTDRPLVPPWSGNRVRILGLMAALRAAGSRVALLVNDRPAAYELRPAVDGIVVVRGRSYQGGDPALEFDVRPFRRAVRDVAAELAPWAAIAEYAWLAPALADVPVGTARWVDCHDVLHERTSRFTGAGLDPWVVLTPEQEAALLDGADVLLASQERDADVLRRLVPAAHVVTLLPPIVLPETAAPAAEDGRSVLAVGAKHAGNDAIRDFVRDAWPRVAARVPGARLRIVGEVAESIAAQPGVDLVGGVDDLVREYAAAAVVVCPVTVGSGVKIKVLEALRHGRPAVVTPTAVEGLPPGAPEPWLLARSLDECADGVARLLLDPAARAELAGRAAAYGERHLSLAAAADRLRPFVERARPPT
jgi:succinoglycan biosynthesis protein ExoO